MLSATEIVLAITRSLDALAIPYMLVGSYSSNFYGRPRQTMDADLVLQTTDLALTPLLAELGPGFQIDPQMSFEGVTGTMRWVIAHKSTAFKVELFQLGLDAHDQMRFQRRRLVPMEGHTVVLPTPEDVVITKLRWSLAANRAKDIEDVRGVLASQVTSMDLAYVRHWCDEHQTRKLLENLLGGMSGKG